MSDSSGSPVVNMNNKIVGQLWGNTNGPLLFWCYTDEDGNDVHCQYHKYIDGEFTMTYKEMIEDVLGTVSLPATPAPDAQRNATTDSVADSRPLTTDH